MENNFQIKEIKVRERIAFWNEGNCKETKLVETSGTKKNVSSEMETLFVVLSLGVQMG